MSFGSFGQGHPATVARRAEVPPSSRGRLTADELGHRPKGILLETFEGVHDPPAGEGLPQFPRVQEVVGISRSAECCLLHREGLVDKEAARSERLADAREKRSMEIAKYQDSTIGIFSERIDSRPLQIHLPEGDRDPAAAGELPCPLKGIAGDVAASDVQPSLGKENAIVALAAGEIQHRSAQGLFQEEVKIRDQELGHLNGL